jgi:tetratricopeptide (TPR) repeat protein
LLFVLLLVCTPAQAADPYERADAFARSGDNRAMEEAYDQLLQKSPDDIRARIGRATARSWQGKTLQAQADFEQVLRLQPDNLDALVGLGYDLAWQGHYDESRSYFERALAIAPDQPGASKGVAYSYLWAGDHLDALNKFESITQQTSTDAEAYVGMGQAHLALGHAKRAALAFENAQSIDSERLDATNGLRAAYDYPALAEVNIWVGNNSSTDETGLRLFEVASSINPDVRIWARYDDSLSLDNPSLARSGVSAETFYLGSLFRLNPKFLASVEAGYRRLPDDKDQGIVKGEAIFLIEDQSVKLGAQLSPHSDGFTDSLVFAEYGFPVSPRWRLSPTVFYSSTGQDRDKEYRVLVDAGYRSPDRWAVNFGAAVGGIDSAIPSASGDVYVANAELRLPIAGYHSINFAVRYERNPTNEFTIAMMGLTMRWPHF